MSSYFAIPLFQLTNKSIMDFLYFILLQNLNFHKIISLVSVLGVKMFCFGSGNNMFIVNENDSLHVFLYKITHESSQKFRSS